MSATLLQLFEAYQRSRVQFVQGVADAANRPSNIETLHAAGAIQLLRPLLLDNVSGVGRRGVGEKHPHPLRRRR